MRYLFLAMMAFMVSAPLFSQSKKELKASLNRDLEAYRKWSLEANFDSSMMFMPPKMFDIIPKDSMISTMKNSMHNEYMDISMTAINIKPKSAPKIKKAGKYHWTFVPYEATIRFSLKGDGGALDLMSNMMKAQFGEENVKKEGDNILDVYLKDKRLIAFKDPDSRIWSLLEDKRSENDMQREFLQNILPAEILGALGKAK